ncbi:Pimeloyl-[acyl-carrier protein] methyl ester esterase [Paenibacillus plantiphilus]|uniref:Pimeloyl-[acyl-carrier protein] methyl ester esterase n=1 Tax=Paenibacillus plantiphilus TaxID=2905650 RepID=A0ABM9BS28_9BACL|nr:alpha/beta hydrolase [Paenibacillus plantiphilus]CAH1193659.1 Pimeloyl-[acyl-carrier protein] methyl ester esterase [Paenibacillus plantiphilus]
MTVGTEQHSHPAVTVLWLSGWSFDDAAFTTLRGHLPAEWRHVPVRYEHADSPEQFYAMASTAAEACRRSAAGRLLIIGWSLGSLLALRIAADGLADGIVLLNGTARFVRPKGETELGWLDAYVRQMGTEIKHDRAAVELKFREALLTAQELENGCVQELPPAESWSTEALLAGLNVLRNEDCRGLLSTITLPALLIHGVEDTICPIGAALELQVRLPHARLITLEASGHAVCITRHQEASDEIRRWWHEWQAASDTAAI